MPVLKIHAGKAWHVIHETKTSRLSQGSAVTICRPDVVCTVVAVEARAPTCRLCLALDNPLTLSVSDREGLKAGVMQETVFSTPHAQRLDLFTERHVLTRRGHLLARDFTEGAAPWVDAAGIGHGRYPLRDVALCDATTANLHVGMTIERYGKLRLLGTAVTCIRCLGVTS